MATHNAPQTSPVPAPPSTTNNGPQMRSRITVVCGECKRLKLKCDRRNPCSSCVKRDTVVRCIYSPAAAEKVDLHSLNNRMIQVETTLTQITSGISPPPFVSAYPPASSGAASQAPYNTDSSSTQPLNPTSSVNSGSSTATVRAQPYTRSPPSPPNQPYHSVFSPPAKGDRSAMAIPMAVIFGTFLAGTFRLPSPGELEDDEVSLLQHLGLDFASPTNSSGKGKAPVRQSTLSSGATFSQTGLSCNMDPNGVKLEPTLDSLHPYSRPASSTGLLPSNMMSGHSGYSANSSAHNLSSASFPYNPQASASNRSTFMHMGRDSSNHAIHALPPLSAYYYPSAPQTGHEYVFSSSDVPTPSTLPPSRHGVTPALISCLPAWTEIRSLLYTVEQYERLAGVREDYGPLEQRIKAMLDGTPSLDGQLPGLSFFSSVCALLALGSELRQRLNHDNHDDYDVQMTFDDQQSDIGKGNIVYGEGEGNPRQWIKNPNFMSHKSFGASAHTMSSALQSFSTPSNPPLNTPHPSSHPTVERVVDPEFLYKLSAQALWMADSEPEKQPADIDYVLTCLWQVKYIYARARTKPIALEGIRDTVLSLVGKMVVVAKQLELGRDLGDDPERDREPVESSESIPRRSQHDVERRVWWEVVFYDLFVSDSLNHPPMISSTYLPPSSTQAPSSSHQYLASRECDPTSMFYETTSPYLTQLPNTPSPAAGIMSEFELRCRLAQLVKIVQVRVTSKNGYSFEQAASYDAELRATLAIFLEGWSCSSPETESPLRQGGVTQEDLSSTRPETSFELLKAEATIIINRLAIRLYLPFVQLQDPTTADVPESRTRPMLHQATYGLVSAAHGLLDAARAAADLLATISPLCSAPPYILLDFYGFGRMVFDATSICSYACATQPNAMWAPQAREDVSIGAEIISAQACKIFWSSRITGASSTAKQDIAMSWDDASPVIGLLKKKVDAIHGAAVGRVTLGLTSNQNTKRKFSDAQVLPDGEVDEGARRGEADARHDATQFDRSSALNATLVTGLDQPTTSPYDSTPRISAYSPVDAPSFRGPQSPIDPLAGPYGPHRSRRLSTSTTSSTASTALTFASDVSKGLSKPPRVKRKDKEKSQPTPLGLRQRNSFNSSFTRDVSRMPLTSRSKQRLALSSADIDHMPDPAGSPLDDPVHNPPEHPQEQMIARPREQEFNYNETQIRPEVPPIRQGPALQQATPHTTSESPISYSTTYAEYSPRHARHPSGHEGTPLQDVPSQPNPIYGQTPVAYDSPRSYDGSAPSPYGAANSTASSPYTHTSGNPQPVSGFNASPHNSSPPVFDTQTTVLSASNNSYYMNPAAHGNPPCDASYASVPGPHRQTSAAVFDPSYQMKPSVDPSTASAQQVHDMNMQPPQHASYPQHTPWQSNAPQNVIVEQQQSRITFNDWSQQGNYTSGKYYPN